MSNAVGVSARRAIRDRPLADLPKSDEGEGPVRYVRRTFEALDRHRRIGVPWAQIADRLALLDLRARSGGVVPASTLRSYFFEERQRRQFEVETARRRGRGLSTTRLPVPASLDATEAVSGIRLPAPVLPPATSTAAVDSRLEGLTPARQALREELLSRAGSQS